MGLQNMDAFRDRGFGIRRRPRKLSSSHLLCKIASKLTLIATHELACVLLRCSRTRTLLLLLEEVCGGGGGASSSFAASQELLPRAVINRAHGPCVCIMPAQPLCMPCKLRPPPATQNLGDPHKAREETLLRGPIGL
jgi:hypothetical protein